MILSLRVLPEIRMISCQVRLTGSYSELMKSIDSMRGWSSIPTPAASSSLSRLVPTPSTVVDFVPSSLLSA